MHNLVGRIDRPNPPVPYNFPNQTPVLSRQPKSASLSRPLGLLLDLALNAPLQGLALVVLQLPLLLLGLVASQARNSATDGTTDAVADALAQIAQLTLSLLALAIGILLLAGLAQALHTQHATDGLLACSDGLVPRAGAAIGVVGCDALRGDGVAADVGARVGNVVLGFGFGLPLLGLVLY